MGSFQRTIDFRLQPSTLRKFLVDMSQFQQWLPQQWRDFEAITKTQKGKGARSMFNFKALGLDLPSEIEVTINTEDCIQWSVAAPPMEMHIRFNLSGVNGGTAVGIDGSWALQKLPPWRVRTQARARMHMDKDCQALFSTLTTGLSQAGKQLKDPEVEKPKAKITAALTDDGFQAVCTLDDIAPGTSKVVEALGKEIALFNIDGALHAINNLCPHRQAPLAHGQREGNVVTCPLHRWSFDITTGAGVSHPKTKVNCFQVRLEGDEVQIGAPQ